MLPTLLCHVNKLHCHPDSLNNSVFQCFRLTNSSNNRSIMIRITTIVEKLNSQLTPKNICYFFNLFSISSLTKIWNALNNFAHKPIIRSEERRVGKESIIIECYFMYN